MSEQNKADKKGLGTGGKVLIGCGALTLLVIVGIVIIGALGAAGVAKVANEVKNQQVEDKKKEENLFNKPYKLGEQVVVSDVQWTLTEAKPLGKTLKSLFGEFGDDCVANSGQFIKIQVKIKNNSKEMVSVTNLPLLDSQKREFITSSDVFGCVEDDLFILDNINPGIEKTFVGIYEIPSDAKDLRLKVGDLKLLEDNTSYISLGF